MYQTTVKLPIDGWYVEGDMILPVKVKSLIIFSGASCRYEPWSNKMAHYLQQAGFGTLLFNLMQNKELEESDYKINIDLLTQRLVAFTMWVQSHSEYHDLDLGYMGFSIGAATALRAAAELGGCIKAVVTDNGRTNLARDRFSQIVSPILMLVGELDYYSHKLNQIALKKLHCNKKLVVIPGTSHSLEEPGPLKMAANNTVSWFSKYLATSSLQVEYGFPGASA